MILDSIVVLGTIGLLAAVLLYLASTRFKVEEDPRISEIEELLPGANCGGCGHTGCHAFAVAVLAADSLEGLNCSVAGADGMALIAKAVGLDPARGEKRVAVVKCNPNCNREKTTNYDGVQNCAIENALYQGETDCTSGCLGGGDCVRSCMFGAISIAEGEDVPRVDVSKCTACGLCVKSCPRGVIELRVLPRDVKPVMVACNNRNKGAVAMKECEVSCIGCGKCSRTCKNEAIAVADFLAHIDAEKCSGCGECIEACPRKSIIELN